jgi:DNA-binding PadR family transcriptional regulator
VDDGLVEITDEVANPGGVGAPRKVYGVTALGRATLRAEAQRQAGLLEMARSLDLLEEDA